MPSLNYRKVPKWATQLNREMRTQVADTSKSVIRIIIICYHKLTIIKNDNLKTAQSCLQWHIMCRFSHWYSPSSLAGHAMVSPVAVCSVPPMAQALLCIVTGDDSAVFRFLSIIISNVFYSFSRINKRKSTLWYNMITWSCDFLCNHHGYGNHVKWAYLRPWTICCVENCNHVVVVNIKHSL